MEKYNKIRRIVALLTVVILVVCIITMVVMAVIGSKYFLGFLFLSIALPVILWIPLWFMNLISVKDNIKQMEKTKETEDKQNNQ